MQIFYVSALSLQGLKTNAVATCFPGALETWTLAGTEDSTSALALKFLQLPFHFSIG